MRRARGDLWDWQGTGALLNTKIVISTNIGYAPAPDYRNNMGAGIALQAARRYPALEEWYGRACADARELTPVLEHHGYGLIMFPVKPFNPEETERGWAQDASMELIEGRLPQLADIAERGTPVALSTVGAGPKGSGGGLDPLAVEELLERYLGKFDNVTLVEYATQ